MSTTPKMVNNSPGSYTKASSSNIVVPNQLKDNLITPGDNDRVAIEKDGFNITDTYIANTQTILFRGVSICTNQSQDKRVSFSQAMRAIDSHYPDLKFSKDDWLKVKFLLKEKSIYIGKRPYNEIMLHDVLASSEANECMNIELLSRSRE